MFPSMIFRSSLDSECVYQSASNKKKSRGAGNQTYSEETVAGEAHYFGLVATKPVFGVSFKTKLKPFSSPLETSWNIEISLEASLDNIF